MNPYLSAERSNRLSLRAIFAGVLVNYAILLLFLCFAGALGLWSFRFLELPAVLSSLWFWCLLAWVFGVTVASYTASIASRSHDERDGVLHGLVTWAATCTVATGLAIGFRELFGPIEPQTPFIILAVFVGNLASLASALYAGVAAARSEARFRRAHQRDRKTPAAVPRLSGHSAS